MTLDQAYYINPDLVEIESEDDELLNDSTASSSGQQVRHLPPYPTSCDSRMLFRG